MMSGLAWPMLKPPSRGRSLLAVQPFRPRHEVSDQSTDRRLAPSVRLAAALHCFGELVSGTAIVAVIFRYAIAGVGA